MGKSVQTINENVSLIASKNTWIEDLAIQQLIKTSELSGMHKVAGMPDLHPGRGYPIGAAFFTRDTIYPALVGNDIGCGMALWQTNAKLVKTNVDKMTKALADVEAPLSEHWLDQISYLKAEQKLTVSAFDRSLGTIGGGNHFAEFQAIDEVFDQVALDQLGVNKRCLQLLVHSGSRGFGQSILVNHVTRFNHDGLQQGTTDSHEYLTKHNEALRWAEANRQLIAMRFLKAVRAKGERVLDINHNLVVPKTVNNQTGWLHRKGATPSDQGYVIIPGSRGDYSYLVRPLMEGKQNEQVNSLFSLAHGAGRKWKRGDCQSRLSHKYKRADLEQTSLGSRVICANKTLLYDEAPQAYKKCETIIDDLVDAGLVEIVARLKPVLTFKTNGECGA